MSRTYLCVSVDTESDRHPAWRAGPPTFDGVQIGIVERLHPLFTAFGGKPTYLLADEVIADPRSAEQLEGLSGSSELGTLLRESAPAGDDAQRGPTTRLTDRFIRAFGFQPRVFRTGASALGRRTIARLEALGYSVESSVTPNVTLATSRDDLSLSNAPTQPYRADRGDPTREGDSGVFEVPVTIRRRRWSTLPGIGKRLSPRWLRPTWMTEDALVRLMEDEVAEARRAAPSRPVILHALLDATEVVPAASRHASVEADARRTIERLRALLAFAEREAMPMIGLGDVPEILGA